MTTSNNPSIRTDALHGDGKDLNSLVYKFDSTRPWQYFVRGNPIASSVEKGRRKLVTSHKFQKTYVAKDRRTILRRKNAAFRDVDQLLLTCRHSGKIQVLLKKNHLDNPSVEPDQRGQRTPRKFLPLVKNMVINFVCSYEASESHYWKSRTNAKKYFDSKVSMRQMWSEFLKENPVLKTTSLRRNNNGPV